MSDTPTPMQRVRTVISAIDELPIMPSNVADRALDRYFDRRDKRAKSSARWSEIEARRHLDGREGSSLFLSEEAGLNWAEWEEQQRIERAITPEPWWLGTAKKAKHYWTLGDALGVGEWWYDRARRGWGKRDVWNMNHYLARVLSEMLGTLADEAHGWPNKKYETFEEWQDALRENAAALSEWYKGERGENDNLGDRWYEAACESERKDEAKELYEQVRIEEAARLARARKSMHWVADHFESLWD
jgi:hypothetical protein